MPRNHFSDDKLSGPQARLDALSATLGDCLLADTPALEARLAGLRRRIGQAKPVDRGLPALEAEVRASAVRAERRRARLPEPLFPEELPVTQRREDLARAIAAHQVVVVCGETGSGKTTQLPKICLALGRGVRGMIGHTQPRRIAARSLATRIASELRSELGQTVGYKIRFSDRLSPDSFVKVMTDGILLAEIQSDPLLLAYDTLIIDEAHERSLNIDFLLGYLKHLLPRRPDLKLIITSATIDPERFSRHFAGAPIVEVSGRTYPVEVRYRPLVSEDPDEQDRDLPQAVLDAVDELARDGGGDVLVFLSGEREIREIAEALRKHHPPQTEILPLFSRLSAAEQNRVFQPHGRRRIVLATNVAETSLTVPGIRYVVDAGHARISRYSYRSKMQRLPVEKVSRASAEQRKGRCGRVAAGVCIRLYSEEDFLARPDFTDPEIQRTNLAAVILRMAALGLGEVADFPFVEPPDRRFISDGYRLLFELGAVDERRRLTEIGRRLSRLPIDPRVGRMILAASEERCLNEVLIIASALSVQDPRERPLDAQEKADQAHARYRDERSDFLAYLALWSEFTEQQKHLSQNKLRKHCRERFLSYVRLREWQDIHGQLKALAAEAGARPNQLPAEYEQVHRALLAGLLGNIGLRQEKDEYQGARNSRFYLFPGSGLFRKGPKWAMAAELVETSRLYARTVAKIDPTWIERLAPHLVKRSYSEPHWEKRPAQVAAFEQVSLYGLIVTARRKVNYGPVAPAEAREIFIREALVGGAYRSRGAFLAHNQALIEELEAVEAKTRRRDVLVDEQAIYAFYDARIPEGIYSGAGFERWRQEVEREQPRLLFLTRELLMREDASRAAAEEFPDQFTLAGLRLPLAYRFEPGHPEDGVTVTVPLAALNQLDAAPFDWLVPGLLEDKLVQLIKGLPKALRRNFVPAPNFAAAALDVLTPGEGSVTEALGRQLQRMTGVQVPAQAWQPRDLPDHLRMNFSVVDAAGAVLAVGRDLEALRQRLEDRAGESFSALADQGLEREEVTRWDFGPLAEEVEFSRDGLPLRGYPALVEEGERVALRLLDTPAKARAATRTGVRRLFMVEARDRVRYLRKHLPQVDRMCLRYATLGPCEELKDDLVRCILEQALFEDGDLPRDAAAFEQRAARARASLLEVANATCAVVGEILDEYQQTAKAMRGNVQPAWLPALADIQEQLGGLVYRGFLRDIPYQWLAHLPRYLKAVRVRLDKLPRDPERDRRHTLELKRLSEDYRQRADKHRRQGIEDPALEQYRWMLEELRVSLFAQELKTMLPVSVQRLEKYWKEVRT